MPVGPDKFDLNRCNESPLVGEKPDFFLPLSKFSTGSLPLCGILPVKINLGDFKKTGSLHMAMAVTNVEVRQPSSEFFRVLFVARTSYCSSCYRPISV